MTANHVTPQAFRFINLMPLVLLVSWPFISFLANNKNEVLRLADVLIPWAAYQMFILTAIFVTLMLLKNTSFNRLCIVFGLLSVTFFSFGSIAHLLILSGVQRGTIWLTIWFVIFVLTGRLSWILSKRSSATFVSTAIALALVSWPLVHLAYPLPRDITVTIERQLPNETPNGAPVHNVYWFLLDGYTRSDSLKKYFDHDNEPFLGFLKAHNFKIATNAYSNYDNTTLSLTSTLNMNYQQLPEGSPPDATSQVSTLSGFNPVVQKFSSLGYRYIHAPYGGAAKTQCGGNEYRCIRARPSGRLPLNEVQISLLQLTPLFRVFRKVLKGAFQYDHIFVDDIIANVRLPEEAPFFLFAHILSPHAPPRFTSDCKRLGGVIKPVNVGGSGYDPAQFRVDTACTNRSLQKAVTLIEELDKSDPIIILQGDHGFKFRLPGEPPTDPDKATEGAEPFRRLAILNAIRLPNSCQQFFYDTISPINTFPLVFACIQGHEPTYKKEHYYLRPWGADGKIIRADPSQSRSFTLKP